MPDDDDVSTTSVVAAVTAIAGGTGAPENLIELDLAEIAVSRGQLEIVEGGGIVGVRYALPGKGV